MCGEPGTEHLLRIEQAIEVLACAPPVEIVQRGARFLMEEKVRMQIHRRADRLPDRDQSPARRQELHLVRLAACFTRCAYVQSLQAVRDIFIGCLIHANEKPDQPGGDSQRGTEGKCGEPSELLHQNRSNGR